MVTKTCIILVATITLPVQWADAQKPTHVPRIGFLSPESQQSGRFQSFRQGLLELGYVEGKNIIIEHRGSEELAQLERFAAELLRAKVAVLVTQGRATVQAKNAANDIPHVFGISGDPVEAGLVRTLAQPGGNLTGITFLAFELVGKRLEVLKEAIPKVSRVGVIASPAHPGEQRELSETRNTAHGLGMSVLYHQVNTTPDVQTGIERQAPTTAQGSQPWHSPNRNFVESP